MSPICKSIARNRYSFAQVSRQKSLSNRWMRRWRNIDFTFSRILVCALSMIVAGNGCVKTMEIESVDWQLIEMGGATVAPLPGETRPSLLLDPKKKSVTGFAGCNRYFAQYELDGSKLKFGPIGATRRACPDAESSIEWKFLEALENTRAWEFKNNTLSLLSGTEVLARFKKKKADDTQPAIGSLTVHSSVLKGVPITLKNYEYQQPAAPGSASSVTVRLTDKRAFATIEGNEIGAVIVVTNTGGSGSFYELALLSKRGDAWVNDDTLLLGDRVKVHSVALKGGQVVVVMSTHAPQDPQCCPTLQITKRFAVESGRMIPVVEGNTIKQPQLSGTRWQWVQTRYNNDKLVTPSKPENYSIEFKEGGLVDIKADCNLKGGEYTVDGKRLSIKVLNSTMAACEADSLENEYVRNLTASVNYFFKDGDLFIDMIYDTGTMKFSLQP